MKVIVNQSKLDQTTLMLVYITATRNIEGKVFGFGSAEIQTTAINVMFSRENDLYLFLQGGERKRKKIINMCICSTQVEHRII